MSEINRSATEPEAIRKQISELRRIRMVMFSRPVVVFGVVVIALVILTAIFAPLIAPYPPNEQDLKAGLEGPSARHLLGTDELGRDTLSRLIYGSRISIIVGVGTAFFASITGMTLGLAAGFFGSWVEMVIMRFVDALMSMPPLILMLAIAAMLGGGLQNVLVALSIGILPVYCRLMNGQIMSLKETDFVTAAQIIGSSDRRIMFRHLLPNAFPIILVAVTTNMGVSILAEASLSFLGIGVSPPTATWGAMVSSGYRYLITNPLLSFAPGVSILLTVLSFNMAGDGLRDALDPRLRGVI
jgi:peptide/nickel transport system permease protein